MRDVTRANFGILIAYILPGLVTLRGLSWMSPDSTLWLSDAIISQATVGGFLYVTLAALAAGLSVSTLRWAVVDQLIHRLVIREPERDFSRLHEKLAAYDYLVTSHYQFYQFYGNSLIAIALAGIGYHIHYDRHSWAISLAVVFLLVLFWSAACDTLKKYYQQGEILLKKQERDDRIEENQTNDQRPDEAETD